MSLPVSFPCIAPKCKKTSAPGHAICEYHLFLEIVITFSIGLVAIGGAVCAFLRIAGN